MRISPFSSIKASNRLTTLQLAGKSRMIYRGITLLISVIQLYRRGIKLPCTKSKEVLGGGRGLSHSTGIVNCWYLFTLSL